MGESSANNGAGVAIHYPNVGEVGGYREIGGGQIYAEDLGVRINPAGGTTAALLPGFAGVPNGRRIVIQVADRSPGGGGRVLITSPAADGVTAIGGTTAAIQVLDRQTIVLEKVGTTTQPARALWAIVGRSLQNANSPQAVGQIPASFGEAVAAAAAVPIAVGGVFVLVSAALGLTDSNTKGIPFVAFNLSGLSDFTIDALGGMTYRVTATAFVTNLVAGATVTLAFFVNAVLARSRAYVTNAVPDGFLMQLDALLTLDPGDAIDLRVTSSAVDTVTLSDLVFAINPSGGS